MPFRILFVIDAIVAAIFIYFFFTGLGDGSITSFNMKLWVFILAGLAGVILCGLVLRKLGWILLANLVLALIAVPALCYGLFLLTIILTGERWN